MSVLPVSPSMYFEDFSFSLMNYQIIRNSETIGEYKGLSNEENGEKYIHFLVSDNPDIQVGDILVSSDDDHMQVKVIKFDSYNGERALLKAIY